MRVARSLGEIEALGSIWDALMNPELTLFQRHQWNLLAAKIFGRREEPFFVLAENNHGAAILPAVIQVQSRRIGFAGEALFDYRDYLAVGDSAPLVSAWQELAAVEMPMSVTAICRSHAPIWQHMQKEFFSRAPRIYRSQMTSDQLVQNHPRAFSRIRKLERIGLRITQHSGGSPIVADIYRRRTAQSTPGELFHDPLRSEFMRTICRMEGSRCEVFALEHGSTLAAALVTFRESEWRRFYTIFYDHRWARFSPGVSLLFEVVRRSLEQGISVDLMTGEQTYKMRIAQTSDDLFTASATAAGMGEIFAASAAAEWAA
ncbi:MAG TPA: GNAT family N-acetyltransferase [Blastocatellia bacterium]|nr:GNAT family N-acetyltransferase [Blastocatellia bacterium]